MQTANRTFAFTLDGVRFDVVKGQRFDDDHPMVRDFPWLFGPVVEQATAAPGEIRNVSRP